MKLYKIILMLVVATGCQAKGIDYFLPQNFSGEVAIVDFKGGNMPEYKNGRQQITIPDSGIVFIDQPFYRGQIDSRYFIKTPHGFSNVDVFLPGMKLGLGKKFIFFEREQSTLMAPDSIHSFVYNEFLFYVGEHLDSGSANKRFEFEKK